MGKIQRKVQRGLAGRIAGVPLGDTGKLHFVKPGSQNRKKSYKGNKNR